LTVVTPDESWRELRKYGCDMAQGYFVSRPLPVAEFRAWIGDPRWAGDRAGLGGRAGRPA